MELEFLFKVLVGFTIGQRILELVLAKLNEKLMKRDGGMVIKETNYIFMVLLHTSWLVGLSYYAFFTELTIDPVIAIVALTFFLIGQCLRVLTIFTLGKQWSTRIMVKPGGKAVNRGIFQWVRHPNYLGVIIELISLPFFAGLFIFGGVFSILNLIILFFRIKKEEQVLMTYSNYGAAFNLKNNND